MTKSKKLRLASSAPNLKLKGSFEAIVAVAEKDIAKRKAAQENATKR